MISTNLREQSSLMARVLHLVDCLLVIGYLWALTYWYRVPWSIHYTRLTIICLVLCLFFFQSFQLYRSWRGWKFYREFFVIIKAWAAVVGILLFYFFIFKISVAYSRAIILIWSLSTPLLLFVIHMAARRVLRFYRQRGRNIRRAVIVGAGDLGISLARELETIPWAGIEIMGFFDDKVDEEPELTAMGKPVLGAITALPGYLEKNDIDYVYIALPMRAERKIFAILRECRSLGARIYLVPDLYLYGLHHAELQSIGKMLILNFNPHTEWKRSFDVLFSLLVIVLSMPLMACIALLIKLEDGGPIIYRHRRITSAGKEFDCLKFRTMRVGADAELKMLLERDPRLKAEWQQTYKLKDDPRITKIGRLLRRTSLDEFPQFFNVFKGDMSVVGARPIVVGELRQYYKESAGRYCSMKPGITGPWQVSKRSNINDYQERVDLDDWYILNYSLWTDIKIILRTIYIMFKRNGAY